MKKSIRTLFLVLITLMLTAACAPAAEEAIDLSQPAQTVLITPEPTPIPTPTAEPTLEPTPSPTPVPTPSLTPVPTPSPTPVSTVEPGAPDVIGIYTRSSNRTLIEEFEGVWKRGQDIYIFDVYASQKELLERKSHKELFDDYWYAFPLADDYKIGYCVKFTLDTGVTHTLDIRLPKDCPKDPEAFFYPYVEIYVYDNTNRNWGEKFYHLEEHTTYPYTLMTAIKLTPGVRINEVTAIVLQTFIYKDNNDFDVVTGEYIGEVSYTIPVIRKE